MQKIVFSNAGSKQLEVIKESRAGAWIQLIKPDDAEILEYAEKYDLDDDLLRDGLDLYESPRVEREGDNIYVFIRYYHPNNGVINATEPLLIIYTPKNIITLQRSDSNIIERLSTPHSGVITTQRTKTLLEILEAANKSYQNHATAITRKIFQVRTQLHEPRISDQALLEFVVMEDDLNEFLSALPPQASVLRGLVTGKFVKLYEEDKELVEDLSLAATEIIELVSSRLKTIVAIRESYDAVAASELNRTFKRLTSISIFLMIPTVVSGLYGMNVKLPFAQQAWAFSFIVAFVAAAATLTVLYFRKRRWL